MSLVGIDDILRFFLCSRLSFFLFADETFIIFLFYQSKEIFTHVFMTFEVYLVSSLSFRFLLIHQIDDDISSIKLCEAQNSFQFFLLLKWECLRMT